MQYYQRKGKIKKKWYQTPLALIVSVAITGILVSSSAHFYDAFRQTRIKRVEAEAKLTELKEHRDRVKTELAALATEAGTERVLREKYRVAKEGEGVVVIVNDKTETVATKPEKRGIVGFFERLFRME